MNRPLSIAELAAMAAEAEDQTETQVAGEFERELIPAGPNFARLIEYIECGKHAQKPYQGKEKPPAEMLRLTFELLHPKKSIIEYEVDGVKKKRGQLITIRMKKSMSDKATFKKVFNTMTYGRDSIKHMAQMLGEPFLVTVHHNTSKDASGKEVIYANLNNADGVYSIGAPKHTDPLSGETTDLSKHIPLPFAPLRIFLWNNPTKETWDSLFIDGTKEVKDKDGNVTHESKNWLQEYIVSAINFDGSPLHTMLHGLSDLTLAETSTANVASVELSAENLVEAPASTPTASPSNGAAKAPQPAQAAAKPAAAATPANEALAALGLV